MGCWTGYLLRDEDGTCRFASHKWGDWELADDAVRAEVIDRVRREGTPVEEIGSAWFSGSDCRGAAIDLRERVFRAFTCELKNEHRESLDRRIRTRWPGWDAGLAWGGREDFGDLFPEARHVIRPYDLWFRPLAELEFEESDWDECDLVSVITPDLRVLDYRLARHYADADTLLPWLVHGEGFTDALGEREPHGMQVEELVNAGLVIDMHRRTMGFWTPDTVPGRLFTVVRAAWPGWDVRRLRYGLAEHLATTGRRDNEALESYDNVDPEWEAARRTLEPDPRPLLVPD